MNTLLGSAAALIGVGLLTGVAVFTYFGGYWWQLWEQRRRKENDEHHR